MIEDLSLPPSYDTSDRCPRKYTPEVDALLDQILENEEEKTRLWGITPAAVDLYADLGIDQKRWIRCWIIDDHKKDQREEKPTQRMLHQPRV